MRYSVTLVDERTLTSCTAPSQQSLEEPLKEMFSEVLGSLPLIILLGIQGVVQAKSSWTLEVRLMRLLTVHTTLWQMAEARMPDFLPTKVIVLEVPESGDSQ